LGKPINIEPGIKRGDFQGSPEKGSKMLLGKSERDRRTKKDYGLELKGESAPVETGNLSSGAGQLTRPGNKGGEKCQYLEGNSGSSG